MLAKTYSLILTVVVAWSSPAAAVPCKDFAGKSFTGGVKSAKECRTACEIVEGYKPFEIVKEETSWVTGETTSYVDAIVQPEEFKVFRSTIHRSIVHRVRRKE